MSNVKFFTTKVEHQAIAQIQELVSQDAFSDAKIRIMPDVHAGKGCVVGFTADLGDKVIPNVIGVDIGCGVLAASLGKIDIDYAALDNFIKENIPSGFEVHSTQKSDFYLKRMYCYSALHAVDRIMCGIGTLGGGNHFIEVDADEDDNKYLLIHTGSRNLGHQVATFYQELAIKNHHTAPVAAQNELIARLKAEGRQQEIAAELAALKKDYAASSIPKDLCYLEGKDREAYLHDMKMCQEYARLNRKTIANDILKFLGVKDAVFIESVHNYIDDYNIVRKGAIAAHKGEYVLIPLNMRDGVIIGRGKGNPDWNYSAPHGAGRLMSRAAARKNLRLEDFQAAMKGIYTSTANENTVDEAPMAYKDAQDIINAIGETIEIEAIIRPQYNFKASE